MAGMDMDHAPPLSPSPEDTISGFATLVTRISEASQSIGHGGPGS